MAWSFWLGADAPGHLLTCIDHKSMKPGRWSAALPSLNVIGGNQEQANDYNRLGLADRSRIECRA